MAPEFVNSAVDFFANIGVGETLQVDDENGQHSPEVLHKVTILFSRRVLK
jgi:hypothetical protein